MGRDIGLYEIIRKCYIRYGQKDVTAFVDELASFLTFEGKRRFKGGKVTIYENDSKRLSTIIIR